MPANALRVANCAWRQKVSEAGKRRDWNVSVLLSSIAETAGMEAGIRESIPYPVRASGREHRRGLVRPCV
jgi:hypothetical protein